MQAESFTLVDVSIAGAVTAVVATPVSMPGSLAPWGEKPSIQTLLLYATFLYGAAGTTVKAWVQTSMDGGTTWMDIANFAFTTAAAVRAYNLTAAAVTSIATPVEGTLADNTSVNGFLGGMYRVKYTTTGTYTGATSLKIVAMPK